MTRLLSLAVVLTGFTFTAADSGSHAPVASSDADMSTQELFDQRFKEAKLSDAIQKLQKLRSPTGLFDSKLRAQLNQPGVAQLLRKIADNDPEIMDLAKRLLRQHDPQFQNYSSDELRALMRQAARQVTPGGSSPTETRPDTARPAAVRQPTLEERELAARRAYAERLGDFLKSIKLPEGVENTLQDSPTVRNMLRELSRNAPTNGGPPTTTLPRNFATNLQRLEGLFGDIKRWLPKKLPRLENVELPRGPRPSGPSFSIGSPGGSGGLSLPSGSSTLLGIAAVVIAAVAAWRWFGRSARTASTMLTATPLEPIDPETVSTREQLIRAVEHLALLRFGWDARHWHHRRIERRLAAVADKGDAAALARWYEEARYAPNAAADWSEARPLLRRLAAGV